MSLFGRFQRSCHSLRFARTKTWVVQKYGGTSLGTTEKLNKVFGIVSRWHEQGPVACVVSALSSHTKSEGTTSRLLAAASASIAQEPFQSYLDAIHETHMNVVDTFSSPALRQEAENHISNELSLVRAFCQSLRVIQELSPRSHDVIVGAGERLSAGLISCFLQDKGLPAKYVDLSSVFGTKEPLDSSKIGYHLDCQNRLREFLPKHGVDTGCLPVVTGYLGEYKGGVIEAIGRGYSDFTAALVAGALDAKVLQVWKESDGIFTANPTKIKDARLIHHVTPREAAELTYFGNEVLHPFTMECAMEAAIPIHILNTFKPDSKGTAVEPGPVNNKNRLHQGIVAIVSKKNLHVLNLSSNRKMTSTSYLAKVFELFSRHAVKIDLISTSESNLSITIHESVSKSQLDDLVKDLGSLGQCTLTSNRAIVSVIGERMKHQVGVASKFFGCMASTGINFEMITQGASEINMSVVINQAHADAAIAALHDRFMTNGTD